MEKLPHNIIGLVNPNPIIFHQAAKVIQYLYWKKHTKVKELTIEKFVLEDEEDYYEVSPFGDIDCNISNKSGWNIHNKYDKIYAASQLIKNEELVMFDPVMEYVSKITDKLPLVLINSVYQDIRHKSSKNHIITGITSNEEENFIKNNGGLLIELPTNNPELKFQEKYLKTILTKFNNL